MFYAHFVLSKRGPLAKIWLAAHWDKKLTKAHVFETNIDSSVEEIIKPKVKMALRTSGHLLLGVVRIYSRKAKYLLADCNEAFVKIKMAFRPGVVDLPEENREAAVATITLPETFHDFDSTMADLSDIDVQAHQFAVNQSRPEEITMREDLGNITLIGDDGFGDMGFDDAEMPRDTTIDDSLYKNPDSSSILLHNREDKPVDSQKPMELDFQAPAKEDDFGEALGSPLYHDDPGAPDDDSDDNDDFGGTVDHELFDTNFMDHGGLFEEPEPEPEESMPPEVESQKSGDHEKDAELEDTAMAQEQTTVLRDQTTLVQNEAEAFALEPLDVTSIGTERKTKRKRKLIVDEQKGIPSETMKMQLSDTSDIVTTLDLAPPTKKLMHWKETGGVEKLFALPGRPIISKRINKLFTRNLITRPTDDRDEEEEDQERIELAPEVNREEEQPPVVEEQLPVPEDIPAVEEPSTVEPAPPTPAPAEVSRRSTRQSDLSLQPETPKPVEQQQQPSPEPEENDDIFMDNLEHAEEPAAEPGKEEEVEDRRWSKRTHQMMHTINRALNHTETASFKELVQRNNRKQVASKFYTLLVLKKQQALELQQHQPYGDIWISPGPRFQEVY